MANENINTITRWTPRRKAAIVASVLAGVTTPEKVCEEHEICPTELWSWIKNYKQVGLGGLMATHVPPVRTGLG